MFLVSIVFFFLHWERLSCDEYNINRIMNAFRRIFFCIVKKRSLGLLSFSDGHGRIRFLQHQYYQLLHWYLGDFNARFEQFRRHVGSTTATFRGRRQLYVHFFKRIKRCSVPRAHLSGNTAPVANHRFGYPRPAGFLSTHRVSGYSDRWIRTVRMVSPSRQTKTNGDTAMQFRLLCRAVQRFGWWTWPCIDRYFPPPSLSSLSLPLVSYPGSDLLAPCSHWRHTTA